MGHGRISKDNKPENFQGDPSEGVFMWPHVYVNVTEDMECFHEEIFGPAVTIVKQEILNMAYILQMHLHTVFLLPYTPTIDWKHIVTRLELKQE